MKVGIALITGFGANLIFSLFFFWPGESMADRIPAIIFSSLMITWGIWRIRGHYKKRGAERAGGSMEGIPHLARSKHTGGGK